MNATFIKLAYVVVLLFASSCSDEVYQWTWQDAGKFVDSSEFVNLIAGYSDAGGHALFLKSGFNKARKVTFISGYPDIVDSLVQTGVHTFKSIRHKTEYCINDSEVVMTYFQKIIHPSSNWQGQTPWQETIVSVYPRLDRNLK